MKSFADYVGFARRGLPPDTVLVILIAVYFFAHYFFQPDRTHQRNDADHARVGLAVPGIAPEKLALGLALTTG